MTGRDRVVAPCFDCGDNTLAADGDWYIVHDHVWKAAWPTKQESYCEQLGPPYEVLPDGQVLLFKPRANDNGKPLSEILCIRCLECRLGRILTPDDFTDALVNKRYQSKRHRDRLKRAPALPFDESEQRS